MKMAPFSFSRIADFPVPDLDRLPLGDAVGNLERSRRRESLFAEADKSSLEWMARAAEYFHDDGAYAESDRYSNRLAIAARAAGDPRLLARACLMQALCAIPNGIRPKLLKRIEQLGVLATETDDPFILASRLFVQSLAFEKCSSWEAPIAVQGEDDWCDVFINYRRAAELFLSAGEYDLAIWSKLEYARSKIGHGEYLTSMEWIEHALQIAQEHNRWKWTGRMLQVAASAATDQGYRHKVEATLRKSITWCDYVGDMWGRIESLTAIGRLCSFEMPSMDEEQAAIAEGYLEQASAAARASGFPWLLRRAEHAKKFVRVKSGIGIPQGEEGANFETNRIAAKIDLDLKKRVRSRLEDGVSDSPDAFLVFNALRNESAVCEDFLNEYRNAAGARIVGRGPAYVVLFSEMLHSPFFYDLADPLFDAVEKRQIFEDVIEVAEGSEQHWYRRRVTPSGDGAVLKLRNVTPEHRVEEALRMAAESALRSERLMSEFLANMSHEIRTPLSGVLGLARVLSETNLDSVQSRYVKDIIGSGDILLGLIGDILDMSKLDAGFIDILPEPVNLREMITGIAGLYSGQAAEHGVSVHTKVDDSVPEVILADGVRLRQVLANLVGNSVKFTRAGSISIDVTVESAEIVFGISDTGIGIPTDRLNVIFEPFRQASRSPLSTNGTGLGLTISNRLIQLMGGSIDVTSREGEGSRFVARIPLRLSVAPAKQAPVERTERFERMKVLLVEDNEINMIVSNHFLTKFGCTVVCTDNGRKALEAIGNERFDLVLMDVRMPILDGLDATREIRRLEQDAAWRTPIVALTAGALAEEREACFQAGMDDYMSKPFADESLREVLTKWKPQ